MQDPTATMLDMLMRVVTLTVITASIQAVIFGVAAYVVVVLLTRDGR